MSLRHRKRKIKATFNKALVKRILLQWNGAGNSWKLCNVLPSWEMHSLLKRQLSSFMLYCNIHLFPAQWLWFADMGKDKVEKKDISAFSSRLLALRQHYSVIRLLLSRPSCYFWICPFSGFWYQTVSKIEHASVSSPTKWGWKPLLNLKAKYFLNAGCLAINGSVERETMPILQAITCIWTCPLSRFKTECCDWVNSFMASTRKPAINTPT